jgi:hypothetical protein
MLLPTGSVDLALATYDKTYKLLRFHAKIGIRYLFSRSSKSLNADRLI